MNMKPIETCREYIALDGDDGSVTISFRASKHGITIPILVARKLKCGMILIHTCQASPLDLVMDCMEEALRLLGDYQEESDDE